jgi:phosphoribosylanthranilate isomerase
MLIKICGITRVADAAAAVEAGADAVGFVFWERSPRYVDPEFARRIVATLPPFVTPVGVFVNQAPGHVNDVARRVQLGAVQLHGDEAPVVAQAIEGPVIKSVAADAADALAWPDAVLLLVDAADPERRGGTGELADWAQAAAIAARRRVLLAGGLTPENVEEAVARVRPFGVDVSSGVEQSPGVKDPVKIQAFVTAARRAGRGGRR